MLDLHDLKSNLHVSTYSIEKRLYNHGVIEYVFPRTNVGFKLLSRGNKYFTFASYVSNSFVEFIDVPHFIKDWCSDKFVYLFKFDKETISFYTIPRHLQRGLYKVESYTDLKHKTAEELNLHYHPFSTHPHIALSSKVSRKSLHLRRVETVNVIPKIVETKFKRNHLRDCYDYFIKN